MHAEAEDRPLFWEPSLAFFKIATFFILIGAVIFEVALFMFAPDQTVRAWAVFFLGVIAAIGRLLIARGRVTTAVVWLGIGVWGYVTVTSVFLGGVASTTIIIYPSVVLLVGWLVSMRAAIAVAVLTTTVTLGFALVELAGWLPPPALTPPLMRWITEAVVIMVSAVMIGHVVKSYRSRLEEVRAIGAQLQAREHDLHRAQAVARIGSWVYDLANDRAEMSGESCRILGVPEKTAGSYAEYMKRVHETDRAAVAAAWQSLMQNGTPFDCEHRIVVGGKIKWVHQCAEIEFSAQGEALRSVGTLQDITERRQMEAALLESRSQLQCILGATADGILAVDLEGKVILANRRFVDLWRIPQSMVDAGDDHAMLGCAISQLLDPDAFMARVEALYQSDIESTDTIHFKDGRVFERFTSPLVLNEKRVGRIWSFRDVTERERAQRNLNLAVEVTGVLVWELDLATRLFRYDFSMLEKLGIDKGEAPESFDSWCERVHADDLATFNQRVTAALAPGDLMFDLEYRFAGRDGQYQWLHTKGRVIQRDVSGVPLLAVGTTTNVQARKEAEAEVVRLNADLESRVAQRTADLEIANSELNSFSYTIAHDMRAPVRAINGFSEMVLKNNEGKLDATSVGHLKRVVAGSRHMGALIDDLLNLARLSRQEMRRQSFSVSETAEGVTTALATAQPQRTVSVVVQPQMQAHADPGLVRAVLDNLIGNAWKFTGRTAEPKIEIGAREERGATVYFVRDNGAGFDMHYAHKLFVPFQRLHHTEEFDGTGIGLATVKKIVQRHGGRVWIESAVGAGTTVYFTLG